MSGSSAPLGDLFAQPLSHPTVDPGSFRDSSARVFHEGSRVLRALSSSALPSWTALQRTRFYFDALRKRRIIATRVVDEPLSCAPISDLPDGAYLEHDRIPVISYPYEWTFSMLRDAALRTLELLRVALEEDFILKDSSPYNVQWHGANPVFIDVTSFEPYRPGQIWAGYQQFCELFLFPLMLESYRGIPFRHRLRGSIEGISVEEMSRSCSLRDLFRPGIIRHVTVHRRLRSTFSASTRSIGSDLARARFPKHLIQANVRSLHSLVLGMAEPATDSSWITYATDNSYLPDDDAAKKQFVEDALAAKFRSLVVDLGCNTGTYSRLAARSADYVLALDADAAAVESLYRALRAERRGNILPLVFDLVDPSPSLGWHLRERAPLFTRARPSLTLCLALVHHLTLRNNIPLPLVVEWLASLGGDLVVEFVHSDDPMVTALLRNKHGTAHAYSRDLFEHHLRRHFAITRRLTLRSGTRTLYLAVAATDER